MKQIKYIIVVALVSCTLLACNDFLTIDPTDAIQNKDAYRSYDDCVKGLNGMYATFKPTITRPIIFDAMTDDIVYARWGSNSLSDFRKWQYSAGSAEIYGMWAANLTLVNEANTVLFGIDTVAKIAPFTSVQQENINRYKGEVYLARAMATFELLRCFAKPYNPATAGTDPGVPIVREVYLYYTEQPEPIQRSTVDETLVAISNDLDSAARYLPAAGRGNTTSKQITATSMKYLSRAAYFAVKSRVELYRGNYRTVVACRDSLMDTYGCKLIEPDVTASTSFWHIWAFDDVPVSGEVIWMVALTSADASGYQLGNNYNNSTVSTKASPNFLPSGELLNMYETRDYRSVASEIYFTSGVALAQGTTSDPVTLVGKYPSSRNTDGSYYLTGSPYQRASMSKQLRYAEVWLNAVEALYKLKSYSRATQELNYFKVRRNATQIEDGLEPDKLLQEIKKERRREFAFEGMRWFDLKRWGDGVRRPVDYVSQSRFMAAGDAINITADNNRWTFPIPLRELNSNPTIIKNPGY